MAATRHWRDSQPQLHKLVTTIADVVSDPIRRSRWCEILADYPREAEQAVKALEDWEKERKRYFERVLFEPGNEYLRDRTSAPDGLFPIWYERQLTLEEYHLLPAEVRDAAYWEWNPTTRVREHVPCFRIRERNDAPHRAHFYVDCWCPEMYLKFDEARKVHEPLPPSKTGRIGVGSERYTLAEICYALTLLHDLDGAFGELAPRDIQLYLHFNHESSALRLGVAAMANDSWVEDLQPLANRLFVAIRAGVEGNLGIGGAGRPWDENTHARNKFVYEQVMLGVEYTTVILKCKKRADWEEVTSPQGVKDIAHRYAERFNLPKPPRRQGGRRKKANSQ